MTQPEKIQLEAESKIAPRATAPQPALAKLVVHVGLHKTGTSALQKYFADADALVLATDRMGQLGLIESMLRYPTVLLSNESFSADPWIASPVSWFERFRRYTVSLHRTYRPARYIIGFRRHAGFIQSCYRQYLHEGGTMQFRDFFQVASPNSFLDVPPTAWHDRIALLDQLVGPENVFIYTQEDLVHRFTEVRESLESFLGVRLPDRPLPRTNVGVGRTRAALLRRLNQLHQTTAGLHIPRLNRRVLRHVGIGISKRRLCQKWLAFLPESRDFFSPSQKQAINDLYDADWQFVLNRRTFRQEDHRHTHAA